MIIYETYKKISIIIPIYNVEDYISECLQSVMRQTYKGAIECILVDDCGKDNSIAVAEQLIACYKGSIEFRILHHEHNRGLSAARNTGLENAKGKYIYFLDSDDIIDGNSMEMLYNAINSGNYAIAISYFTAYVNGEDRVYDPKWIFDAPRVIEPNEYAERMLMQQSNFASTAKLYKREVLQSIRFKEGVLNEDTLFVIGSIPVVEKNQYTCIDLPFYGYHYRMRAESICHQSSYKMDTAYIENIQVAIDKYRDRINLVEWLKNDQLARCLKVLRDKEVDQTHYLVAAKYLQNYSNQFIHAQKPSSKTYIHFLMIKYMPRLMWYVEHK